MSILPAFFGAMSYQDDAPTRWRTDWTENQNSNEGDYVTFRIQAWNLVPGQSRLLIWAIEDAYQPGRWLADWLNVIRDACIARGLIVQRLSTSTYPPVRGQASIRIDVPVGSTWDGGPILCRNRSRINRTTNKTYEAQGQLLPAPVYDSSPSINTPNPVDGSFDVALFGGSTIFRLYDTSQRPTGTPTIQLQRFDYDGVSPAKTFLEPGDGITVRLRTTNIIPGTAVRIYGANTAVSPDAKNVLTKKFGTSMKEYAANRPANSDYEDGTRWPPLVEGGWYNGGTITIREGWDDATDYFEFKFMVGTKNIPEEGDSVTLDVVALVVHEGTAADFDDYRSRGDWNATTAYTRGDVVNNIEDGIKYISLDITPVGTPLTNQDFWREYLPVQPSSSSFSFSIKDAAHRYWEVRAKANGANIDYQIACPVGVGESVTLTSTNAPPGFAAALAAATGAAGSPVTLSGDTLTVNANVAKYTNQEINFSCPRTGTGQHALTLTGDGSTVIAIGETYAFYADPVLPNDPTYTVGVNLSGGEFGTNPGYYLRNYIYPHTAENPTSASSLQYMNYLWGLGLRTIRLPVRWARIMHGAYAPLYGDRPDPGEDWWQRDEDGVAVWIKSFNENNTTVWRRVEPSEPGAIRAAGSFDMHRIEQIVNYWTITLGGICVFDLHDFGGNNIGGKIRFDKPLRPVDLPIEGLIDVWVKLANRYKTNENVWFGLMNEPNGASEYSPTRCRAIFQTTTNAIRGRTGALNKILVPGTEYCSTMNWVANGQGAAYEDFYDPADNFAFETHLYQDPDASGHSGQCVNNAQNRINAVTTWARTFGFKLFMGEIAGGNPSTTGQQVCAVTTTACYTKMSDNRDVWLGWTSWGYGPWWPTNYAFNLNPTDYQTPSPPSPNMQMLIPFIAHEFT